MKEFWVEVRPWKKALATAALESGADTLVADDPAAAKALGRIRVAGPGGDLAFGRDVFEVSIQDKAGEMEAVTLAGKGYVIVSTSDWTVIPLENLVAQADRVIVRVGSAAEAELAIQVLEKGARGVLLSTADPAVIKEVGAVVKKGSERV
jgi:3-dehydroquinate synthase II